MSETKHLDQRRPEIELAADLLDTFGIPASAVVKYAYARRERQAQRLAAMLMDAASQRGITVEELVARADAAEETSDLLEQLLRASARARSVAHVRAMARVLAVALSGGDGARVNDLPTIVDVLEQLGPVEIRVLHEIGNVVPAALPRHPSGPYESYSCQQAIQQALGGDVLLASVQKSLAELSLLGQQGQAWDHDAPPDHISFLSPLGERVLGFLGDHAPTD